jgi:glutamyl-tRNA reductase
MEIVAVGLNHHTAPVEIREKLAFSPRQLRLALRELSALEGFSGCVILQTCNRTEVYASVHPHAAGNKLIAAFLSRRCELSPSDVARYLYTLSSAEAVRHLFRVAAGLDSMILGEPQILGQVREAYETALNEGTTNGLLNALFQQAIRVGRRVRVETKIDQNAVSVSYAAVQLAKAKAGNLKDLTVLVVGAGKMSTLATEYLVANGVKAVLVSNRSYEKAQALAKRFSGQAIRFDDLAAYLGQADIVITSTNAPHFVIHRDMVEQAVGFRGGRPLIIIDIAVPRDVEPSVAEIPGVSLYNIDDLRQVVENNLALRQRLAGRGEEIVQEETEAFMQWASTLWVAPTIAALRQKGEKIKEAELRRAFNRLGEIAPEQRKIITKLANGIVNQLLRDPIANLKRYSMKGEGPSYAAALSRLFDLPVGQQEGAERS